MAKGQKRSNREAKKPKQPKAKPVAAASRFAPARGEVAPTPAKKG
jgi:hypothetical protein